METSSFQDLFQERTQVILVVAQSDLGFIELFYEAKNWRNFVLSLLPVKQSLQPALRHVGYLQ